MEGGRSISRIFSLAANRNSQWNGVGSAGKKKVKHLGNIDKLHKQIRNPGAFLTTTLWRLRPALGGMDGDLKEQENICLISMPV